MPKGKIQRNRTFWMITIQGAFEMIAHLIDMGVPQKEIYSQLRQQLVRARNIESKHPGLNIAIEEGRAG